MSSLLRGKKAKVALQIVGVLVVGLALLNIGSGFNLTGLRWPELSASGGRSSSGIPAANQLEATFLGGSRFDQSELKVKKGQKYLLKIKAEANGVGCMSAVIVPGLSNTKAQLLRKGKTIRLELDAKRVGKFPPLCAMGIPFDLEILVEEEQV